MTLVIADLGGTPPGLIQGASDKIPSPRREEICALKGEQARAQRVVGDAIVRLFVLEKFGLTRPAVLRGEKGKPYLKEVPAFCFNLSHSGDAVVFAAAGSPVGVDVEKIVPREISAVAARCFSIEEQKKIALSGLPLREFYRIWTQKESLLKCRGEGISALRNAERMGETVRSFELENWSLRSFGSCKAPQYALSVCTAEGESDLSVYVCSAEEVLSAFCR